MAPKSAPKKAQKTAGKSAPKASPKRAKAAPKQAKTASESAKKAPLSRESILLTVAREANSLGWTPEAVEKAAQELGIEASFINETLGEPIDMIVALAAWADDRMLRILPIEEMAELRVREQIALAVRARFEVVTPLKGAVGRALPVLARPWHAAKALRSLYETVDTIWVAAGDASSDYNFYTKRALLAGVFSATLLRWLTDESADHEVTWDFLANRIENVMQIEKIKAKVKDRFAA